MSNIVFSGVFCDDVRQEMGGKVTLVGVYSDNLYPLNPMPTKLSLSAHFSIQMAPHKDPKHIEVSIARSGSSSERGPSVEFQKDPTDEIASVNGGFSVLIDVDEGDVLELVATIDGERHIGRTLFIKLPPKDQPVPSM